MERVVGFKTETYRFIVKSRRRLAVRVDSRSG